VAVLYALGGSYLTVALGRTLVGLNYNQLDKEANFRSDLIHVRENAEAVALLSRERRLKSRLLEHLDELVHNFRLIIHVNRNLGFFTTGYNNLVQVIPALIVAPLFMRGEMEFGVITQSAMAFAHLIGAFSLIVTNFQSISSFAAVVTRLGTLEEAVEEVGMSAVCRRDAGWDTLEEVCTGQGPVLIEDNGRVGFRDLTLRSPVDGRILIRDLTVSLVPGQRVLILGTNEEAKLALFRATAGIWDCGSGTIVRPEAGRIQFLPERPYMPPGTLRELLVHTGQEDQVTDGQIRTILAALELEAVLERSGGLYTQKDWDNVLTLSEQQLLAFARLFLASPDAVFLDRVSSALNPDEVALVLNMLRDRGIAYLMLGRSRHGRRESDDKLEHYDAILELDGAGAWKWRTVSAGKFIEE
jgi:putative ATP-binding cassette transporter